MYMGMTFLLPSPPSLSGSIPMGHGTNKWTSLLTIVEDPNYREGINQLYYYGVIFSGNGGGTNLNSSRVSNDFSLILPRWWSIENAIYRNTSCLHLARSQKDLKVERGTAGCKWFWERARLDPGSDPRSGKRWAAYACYLLVIWLRIIFL
jgi:hypothetical protein